MPLMKKEARCIDWSAVKRRLAISQEASEKAFVQDDQRVQEIFQRRSLDLAHRQNAKRVEAGFRALVCGLGHERYGLELGALLEVLPFAKCTPVPGGPPELVGVINLRGEIRSVVSLSCMLGLVESESAQQARGYIAMLRSGRGELGLQVDHVERITFVALESLTLVGEAGAVLPNRYVRGVTPDRLIILDLSAILTHPVFTWEHVEDVAPEGS